MSPSPAPLEAGGARELPVRNHLPALLAMAVGFGLLAWLAISYMHRAEFFLGRYAFFWVTLCALALSCGVPRFGDRAASLANRVADAMARRGAFRSSPTAEAPKFALLRFLFGLFLVERAVWVLVYLPPADWQDPLIVWAALSPLVAGVLVATGTCTQLTLLYLILIQWQLGERVLRTVTLGNDVAAMLALLLFFASAGAHASVDGWWMRRGGRLGRFLQRTYALDGLPSVGTLQIAKLATLAAYWCVCLYSMLSHLAEPAWMDGSAGPLLLTNNFMSSYHGQFEAFFELGPWAVLLGRVSLWAMLPWYTLLLPCVLFGGLARLYAIAWGLVFFAMSLVVLQLGWLAQFELLFFAGLFWERRWLPGAGDVELAYDDRCRLCRRTVWLLMRLDILRVLRLRPASRCEDWLTEHGIDQDAARGAIHLVDGAGSKTRGFEAYVTLSRSLLLLAPLWPGLLLLRRVGLGDAMYRFVASRRLLWFGECDPVDNGPATPSPSTVRERLDRRSAIVPVAAHLSLLALLFLAAVPAPSLNWEGVPMPTPARRGVEAAHLYGMTPINVFNRADLRMAENWFTLSRVAPSGSLERLPILREDGSRLEWHRSDRVYFGHTLRFRRGALREERGCHFDRFRATIEWLASVDAAPEGTTFEFVQLHQPLPELRLLLDGRYVSQPADVVCRERFDL